MGFQTLDDLCMEKEPLGILCIGAWMGHKSHHCGEEKRPNHSYGILTSDYQPLCSLGKNFEESTTCVTNMSEVFKM
jgi:hypothetical protein